MGSYPRCAPRSGRCEGRQGVVCVRVCLAEASVGLIGGCVRSCRLGGARRHPPAPGSWGLMQVVGLALSREAATDSVAWCVSYCVLAVGHSQGGVECWCVGALAALYKL